jgi:hypothetical protein
MKTFVKIPLSAWSGIRFKVPVAQGNLHTRSKKALSWVNGERVNDPKPKEVGQNPRGGFNAVLTVF